MTETISATVRNGVDTTTMFATLDALRAQPEMPTPADNAEPPDGVGADGLTRG